MSSNVKNSELLKALEASKEANPVENKKAGSPKKTTDKLEKANQDSPQKLLTTTSVELRPVLPKSEKNSEDPERDFKAALEKIALIILHSTNNTQMQSSQMDQQMSYCNNIQKYAADEQMQTLIQQKSNLDAQNTQIQAQKDTKFLSTLSDVIGVLGLIAMPVGMIGGMMLDATSTAARVLSTTCSVVQVAQTAEPLYEAPVALSQASYSRTQGDNTTKLGKITVDSEGLQNTAGVNASFTKRNQSTISESLKATSQTLELATNFNQLNIDAANSVARRI